MVKRAIVVGSCDECMKIRRVGFCWPRKYKPTPDDSGFDSACPLIIIEE